MEISIFYLICVKKNFTSSMFTNACSVIIYTKIQNIFLECNK
jgi:hypothetical protein